MKLLQYLFFVLFIALVAKSSANTISFEEMKQTYGTNKIFVEEAELPAIIALAFYPELKNTSIRFEYKKIATTMAARPLISSLFKQNREYVICINSDVSKNGGVSYSDLNLKQRIGIIAHELAHIVDFEERTNLSVVNCGLLYKCLNTYQKKLERRTDELVIDKGLGNELFAFSDYVINHSKASCKYKEFKKNNYLLPEEIKQKMK
jgi:predicted metallopeptidase